MHGMAPKSGLKRNLEANPRVDHDNFGGPNVESWPYQTVLSWQKQADERMHQSTHAHTGNLPVVHLVHLWRAPAHRCGTARCFSARLPITLAMRFWKKIAASCYQSYDLEAHVKSQHKSMWSMHVKIYWKYVGGCQIMSNSPLATNRVTLIIAWPLQQWARKDLRWSWHGGTQPATIDYGGDQNPSKEIDSSNWTFRNRHA